MGTVVLAGTRKGLFVGILAILMVPHTSLLIPLYIWLDRLSLGNSLVGVSLVMVMYQMPFSVFMMRTRSRRCRVSSRRQL